MFENSMYSLFFIISKYSLVLFRASSETGNILKLLEEARSRVHEAPSVILPPEDSKG